MIHPGVPADYLNVISRAVFSAGLSWAFVDGKWDGFEDAFEGFDPSKVAAYDDVAIDRLTGDPRLYASRKKMAATVENAKALVAIEREFGSIRAWLDSFKAYADATRDVSKRFKYLSKTFGAYYFLYISGAKIPDFPTFEAWSEATGETHPRMRELVAQNEGRSVVIPSVAKRSRGTQPLKRKSSPRSGAH
jgi:hypothetical protein